MRSLDARDNLIDDLESSVMSVVSRMPSMSVLDLRGNPFTSSTLRHWEEVVGVCGSGLRVLNGKQVEEKCGEMVREMAKRRRSRK